MQKRKALTDLLKGLKKLGVSHHKAAVPPSQRKPLAWFLQPPLEPPPLFAAAALGRVSLDASTAQAQGGMGTVGELSLPLAAATRRCWGKAEEYYFRCMARMQVCPPRVLFSTLLQPTRSTLVWFRLVLRDEWREHRLRAWC